MQLARSARPTIMDLEPNLTILMAGICNVTYKDRHAGLIQPRYKDCESAVTAVMEEVNKAYNTLHTRDGNMSIISATVPGIDMADYNNKQRKHMDENEYKRYCETEKILHPAQQLMNETITEINKRITQHNEIRGVLTIWTAGVIHPRRRNKEHHHYAKLYDGCHGTEATKAKWAEQLEQGIKRMKRSRAGEWPHIKRT